MRFVILVTTAITSTLVIASYSSVNIQLASITLASLLGAVIAIYIIRSPHFENIGLKPVFILAVFVQMLALLGQPILEDDHYRYLWDAFRFISDGTPYGAAPSQFFDDSTVPSDFQSILNFINYPDIPTIYGPVLQILFLIAYFIAPGQVEAIQILNSIIFLATLLLLAYCGARPRWLLIYAISPLVIKEAVITAHPDTLTGFLALATFVANGQRFPWLAGGLLGLAIASKISVVLLLPFLWLRAGWRAALATIITLVTCYLPFFILSGSDLSVLSQFAQNWRFNPLFYAILEWLAGPLAGRLLAGIAIMTIILRLYWHDMRAYPNRPAIPPADYVLGALLLFSPVVNPWYLLWLLPFAVLRPSRMAWTATFLLPLSYWNGTFWTGLSDGAFDIPVIVTFIEITILMIAGLYDRMHPLKSAANKAP